MKMYSNRASSIPPSTHVSSMILCVSLSLSPIFCPCLLLHSHLVHRIQTRRPTMHGWSSWRRTPSSMSSQSSRHWWLLCPRPLSTPRFAPTPASSTHSTEHSFLRRALIPVLSTYWCTDLALKQETRILRSITNTCTACAIPYAIELHDSSCDSVPDKIEPNLSPSAARLAGEDGAGESAAAPVHVRHASEPPGAGGHAERGSRAHAEARCCTDGCQGTNHLPACANGAWYTYSTFLQHCIVCLSSDMWPL